MDRRSFMKTVGVTTGLSSLTGCLGYEVVSVEEREAREDRIADLEVTVEERETQITDLEEQISELEDTIENQSGNIDALETRVSSQGQEVRELYAKLYAVGDDAYWTGAELYDMAEGYRGNEEWTQAGVHYSAAAQEFRVATIAYEQARVHVSDAGLSDAETIAQEAVDASLPAHNAMSLLMQASVAKANGNDSDANSLFSQAQEPLGLAIEREPASSGAFNQAL